MPDTIFAPSTAPGRAGISVIRISGPAASQALEALTGREPPPPRRAALRTLRDRAGTPLDQAIVLWLPGPGSFTGEDTAELHVHGGAAVRAAVLAALSDVPGLRTAEPGEFTRRTFLAGRLDLTEVEGLADLIDAETEAQRRQALRQMSGGLGRAAEGWRERLTNVLARLESVIDFSDERDVSEEIGPVPLATVTTVRDEMSALLAAAAHGERVREGFVVVIAGVPNAGKSTLLNAVARREAAIVSDSPGTTRDAIEVVCDLGGLPVTLVDTAGLREGGDAVEREGMRRTRARAAEADLLLWLSAPDAGPSSPPADFPPDRLLLVATKSDLAARPSHEKAGPGGCGQGSALSTHIAVSAATGENVPALLSLIASRLGAQRGTPADGMLTRERHRVAVAAAVSHLDRAAGLSWGDAPELASENIRLALRETGRLVGRVDVEDVLDRIFDQFCIGK